MTKTPKPRTSLSKFDERLRKISSAGVFLALLTPLFFLPFVWHPYAAGKAWLFQGVIALTFPSWCLLAIRQPSFRPRPSGVLFGVLVTLLALSLSTIFGRNAHLSFFGTTDKMDGLVTYLHLGAFFLMCGTLWQTPDHKRKALQTTVAVGAVTAFLALLQIAKPDLLGTQSDIRVSSTLGNPVFLGAYLSTLIGLGVLTLFSQKNHRNWVLGAISISAIALIQTGSRGAIVALAVGLVVGFTAYVFWARNKAWAIALFISLSLGVSGYVVIKNFGIDHPALASFWDSHSNLKRLFWTADIKDRLQIWRLTLPGIAQRPIFGWGPGNYEMLFDAHYIPEEGCAPQGLNDPHNLVLELLSTKGVVGILAFLFLWATLLKSLFLSVRQRHLSWAQGSTLLGTLVSSQVPLFFNPESTATLLLNFFLLAFVERLLPAEKAVYVDTHPLAAWQLPLATAIGWVIAIFVNVFPAMASMHSVEALHALGRQEVGRSVISVQDALALPTPYLEEQLAIGTQLLVKHAEENSLSTLPSWKLLFNGVQETAKRYLSHHQRQHFRMAWLLTLHKVGVATQNNSLLDEAEKEFQNWVNEKPNRQAVLYAYGDLLASRGKLDEAETVFQRALDVAPKVGESHFKLGAFVWEFRREAERGSRLIREGTVAECPFLGRNLTQLAQVSQGLFRQRDYDGLRALVPYADHSWPGPSEKRYVQWASYLEQAGMKAERDQVLRAAIRRLPSSAARLKPILNGTRPLLETP